MRKIQTGDVFKMARIIKAVNVREELAKLAIAAKKNKETDLEKIGIEAFMLLIENASDSNVEKRIYELLAGITEKAAGEIESQTFEATIQDIKAIAKENNVQNFLKSAADLML